MRHKGTQFIYVALQVWKPTKGDEPTKGRGPLITAGPSRLCSGGAALPEYLVMRPVSEITDGHGRGQLAAAGVDQSTLLPLVTFLISTYNRAEVIVRTLAELQRAALESGLVTETIVVDNASTDSTAADVSAKFPDIKLIRSDRNRGACAKNDGLQSANGEIVLFLDDDSCPTAASLPVMVGHFMDEPNLGAAVFDIALPDGSKESSAYPSVAIGCGTAFRREALLEVGGLPTDFFMQAEEYDLSLRLLEARWDIRRFDDLQVKHLKTVVSRVPTRTTRLDVRNNIMIATRYLPKQWARKFATDWTRRYWWIAGTNGIQHQLAALVGMVQGIIQSLKPGHRRPVGLRAFEQFAGMNQCRRGIDRVVRSRQIRSVLLADVGKNALPVLLACRACGVDVLAVVDDRMARPGRKYRGVPVITTDQAGLLMFDAVVVANASPVAGTATARRWKQRTNRPVVDLFNTATVETTNTTPAKRAA
jgi:GT2 family glycosyltransferase